MNLETVRAFITEHCGEVWAPAALACGAAALRHLTPGFQFPAGLCTYWGTPAAAGQRHSSKR